MPQVQKTLTLTIDDQAYAVEKMSPNIQSMVAILDDWRQEAVDAESRLLLVQAALRDLQRQIYNAVVAERQEAMKKMEAFKPVTLPANDSGSGE